MKTKRFLILAAAVCLSAVILTGCGFMGCGNKTEDGTGTTGGAETMAIMSTTTGNQKETSGTTESSTQNATENVTEGTGGLLDDLGEDLSSAVDDMGTDISRDIQDATER